MLVVGICGQTGAGKTTVCSMFSAGGWACLDTDRVARRVVRKGKPCLAALTERFGREILNRRGGLNRRRLAEMVFSSPAAHSDLNKITHPYIMDDIKSWLAVQEKKGFRVAVIDAPLLFESGADRLCHRTLAVVSSPALCCERASQRDRITKERVQARLDHQKSAETLCALCDDVLQNSSGLEDLQKAVISYMRSVEGGLS